jgi:hypothetical protein
MTYSISISVWYNGQELEAKFEGNQIILELPPGAIDPDPEVEPDPEIRFDPEKGLALTSSLATQSSNIPSIAGSAVPDAGAVNRDSSCVLAADFTGLDGSAGGLIFELGGTGLGCYVGFAENGDFHVRAGGGGSALPAADAAYLIVPAAKAPSGDGTLVVELVAGTNSVRAWWNGEVLGSPVARSTGKGSIAGGDRGTYLAVCTSTCAGEVKSAVKCEKASDLRYYFNQTVAA